MHIVQISNDTSLLEDNENSEPVKRQLAYLHELETQIPASRMTIVVSCRKHKGNSKNIGKLSITKVEGKWILWLKVYWQLLQIHRGHPISVITSQKVFGDAWAGLLMRLIYKIPIVGQIHYDIFNDRAVLETLGKGVRGNVMLRLMRLGIRRFDKVRVVGKRTGEELLRQGLALKNSIYVLPVPVPILRMLPAKRSPTGPSVLFVGRLVSQKNLCLWLKVAKGVLEECPNVSFHIVGDGPERAYLEQSASTLGISRNVVFHGTVPNESLGNFYANASVFLLTSFYEGFGRVLVEAFAHAVPCVATQNPGVEDIVKTGVNGFIHDLKDVRGLTHSVVTLLRHEPLATRMGLEGQEYVRKEFDPDRLTMRIVTELIAAARPGSPLLLARRRSFRRMMSIWQRPDSLLRSLQNEIIRNIRLEGRHIDLGGGAKSAYHSSLDVNGTLESANIDVTLQPTHVLDLREPLPFPDESFDGFISFNTFEHIYNDEFLVREAMRIIKRGGTFHILVPFIFRLHAKPIDFNRRTPYWWIQCLSGLGVNCSCLRIEPLVWSRTTSGFAVSEDGRCKLTRLIRKLSMVTAVVEDLLPWKVFTLDDRLIDTPSNQIVADYSVGFYISGNKL